MSNNELLTRGVAKVIPQKLAEEKLKSGKKLRVYLGIDPTGAHLHIGHAVQLRKLQQFADAGHDVIFLIGSFTAMIGDPTGKDTQREPLTPEQVKKNFESYKEQASKVLDFKKIKIEYNHEWLQKLGFEEITKLASNFTVQQMLERDMFQLRRNVKIECPNCHKKIVYRHNPMAGITTNDNPRLSDWKFYVDQILTNEEILYSRDKQNRRGQQCENCNFIIEYFRLKPNDISSPEPIALHEFMYPLMVGYDSVHLDVDCEIGGTDQEFNMLAGRTLQKAYGKREKFVLTNKLIEGTDGRKMSKTYDNCIYLDDSPKDMYGKTLSIKDELITLYMECCTDISMKEIEDIEKEMKKGANPKEFKMRLARELVTMYHSAEASQKAEEEFSSVFAKGGIPDDMPEAKVKKGESLIDLLVRENIVASKSEARRLIDQKAVSIDGTLIESHDQIAEKGIVKVGKRKFVKIS